MLTVTIDNPAHAPGTVFSIQGLGTFENGVSKEIDTATEEKYLVVTGRSVADIGDEIITVEGSATVDKPVVPLETGDAPGTDNGLTQEDVEKELDPPKEDGTDSERSEA